MSAAGARRFPIRFKLTAALAVPVAILLVVSVSQVLTARQSAQEANEQAELALAAEGPGGVYDAISEERSVTGLYLLGVDPENAAEEGLQRSRPPTDEMVSEFEDLIGGKSGAVQTIYRPAVEGLSTLDELRAQVDAYEGQRAPGDPEAVAIFREVIDGYTAIIDSLTAANLEVAAAIAEPSLRRGAELVRLASRQGDLAAKVIAHLILSINNHDNVSTRMADLSATHGDLVSNDQLLRASIDGPYLRYAGDLDDGEEMEHWNELVRDSLAKGEYDAVAGAERGDNQGMEDTEDWIYTVFRENVAGELRQQAESLRDDATRRQWLYLVMGMLVLAVAGAAAWLVSRSITGPLRSLTKQATQMAGVRLPGAVQQVLETPLGEDVVVPKVAPIVVETSDEVADVAQALTTVQDSALNLAVEQAVLRRNIADSFVNLGRRNQALLSRQLDFITALEQHEADSEALANLFRLDHLATRMRRNAESLLVLGGDEPPRQWGAPVRLTEVIRSALGEVEGYQRVLVRDIRPISVVGSSAADLAHLLAELIENALVFSSPSTTVTVRGRNQPVPVPDGPEPPSPNDPAAAVGYALEIVDSGMGMHPDEVAEANRRLAGAESFTIAPSKYLGHYVAGIIAARHGIAVQLHGSSGSGTVAVVILPPTLLATGHPQMQRELPAASN